MRKCLDLLSNLLNTFFMEMYRDQFGEFVCGYWGIKGLNGQHNNSITFLQDRLWNVRGFSHAEKCLKNYANDKNSCLLNPGQLVTHISKVNKVFCE